MSNAKLYTKGYWTPGSKRSVQRVVILRRPNAENQACPCCNSYRTVMGTVVLKCAVCGDEEFDMADMPYSHP